MPGYSGTPLAKKLGIREGSHVALVGVPPEVMSEIQPALSSCRIATDGRGPFDFIFLFASSQAEFRPRLAKMTKALAPAGMLWASWPKKASGVPTDLTEDVIRQIGLKAGLVDIKVCAVTDVWSGLKFVVPLRNRPKADVRPVKNHGAQEPLLDPTRRDAACCVSLSAASTAGRWPEPLPDAPRLPSSSSRQCRCGRESSETRRRQHCPVQP